MEPQQNSTPKAPRTLQRSNTDYDTSKWVTSFVKGHSLPMLGCVCLLMLLSMKPF